MAVEILIDSEDRCVVALFVDAVDLDSLMALEAGQTGDPRFERALNQIVLIPADCEVIVEGAALREFARRPPIFEPHVHRAIVAESGVGFGVSRMFEMVKDDSAGHILVTSALDDACDHVGVSRDRVEDALRELGRGPWRDAV